MSKIKNYFNKLITRFKNYVPNTMATIKKDGKREISRLIIRFIGISMLLWGSIGYIDDQQQIQRNKDTIEVINEIKDTIGINPDTKVFDWAVFNTKMAAQNPDYVGWIIFEGLEIEFPVVLGDDNSYYLKHTFTNGYSKYGSIFMDYRNKGDFSDNQVVIYGHNMRDGQMFGPVEKLKDPAYYAGHEQVTIQTPAGLRTYRIFAITLVDADVVTMSLPKNDIPVQEKIDYYKSKALYATDVDTSKATQLLTLISCDDFVENGRIFIHAILVE
jgi:sortase B